MNNDQNHEQTPSDKATQELASDLREQVRQLNYATAGPPGLTRPATVYSVLGGLTAAVYGLDQTLDQLGQFLSHDLEAGHLGHDRGDSPAQAIQRAGEQLSQARAYSRRLSITLGHAQSAINAIHGPITPELDRVAPIARDATDRPAVREEPLGVAADFVADDFPMPIVDALGTGDEQVPEPPVRRSAHQPGSVIRKGV